MSDVLAFYAAIGVDLLDRPGEIPTSCFLPDHGDRNASASVNAGTGAWYCHRCNVGGGPYQAAIEMGRTKEDAVELAKQHGLVTRSNPSPTDTPETVGRWTICAASSPLERRPSAARGSRFAIVGRSG